MLLIILILKTALRHGVDNVTNINVQSKPRKSPFMVLLKVYTPIVLNKGILVVMP